jgi:hypothetical protein
MGVLAGSMSAEEGALRILEAALEAWGNNKAADNVSIVVVNFIWQNEDGSVHGGTHGATIAKASNSEVTSW